MALTSIYYLCALLLACGIFAFLYFTRKKDFIPKLTNRQLIAILYGALFFVRSFGGVYKIRDTIGLNNYSPFGPHGSTQALLSVLIMWLIYVVQLCIVLIPSSISTFLS